MNQEKRRVLVIGGTGAVGSAVVRELSQAELSPMFTYCNSEARAVALAEELGLRRLRVDLRDASALPKLVASLEAENNLPDVVIHCATIVRQARVDVATDEDWDTTMHVNARSAFQICREWGGRLGARGGGDIVFVAALDRTQSLPIPPVFAASQGLVSALAMAAAKDLGPRGVRVNVVALGLLGTGIGAELDPKLVEDYHAMSALRRLGDAGEVAKTIAWLALHNTYLNGKVVSVNGGI
ncbi:MAG: SDR family oxidoreductase [Polyangiaceae bacterium]|nr:SDR family oxidoreductase [Polyangiaceae bacterium]